MRMLVPGAVRLCLAAAPTGAEAVVGSSSGNLRWRWLKVMWLAVQQMLLSRIVSGGRWVRWDVRSARSA